MLRATVTGILAASLIWLTQRVEVNWAFSHLNHPYGNPWIFCLLGLALAVFDLFWLRIEHSDSSSRTLSQFMVSIFQFQPRGSIILWFRRAIHSFFLAVLGGRVGLEGVAMEVSQIFSVWTRPRSANWFETQRRTDTAAVLAAGVAAAFGAPLAGIVFAVELGIGGSILPAILAALVARGLTVVWGTQLHLNWPMLQFAGGLREWLSLGGIVCVTGLLSAFLIVFVTQAQNSVRSANRMPAWLRPLIGGILLTVLAYAYKSGQISPEGTLSLLLSEPLSPIKIGLLFLSQFLFFVVVASLFGTSGIIWPLFALGCLLGFGLESAMPGVPRASLVIGGAAMVGAVLDSPIAGSLLAYELTGQPSVLLPCVLASYLAVWLRKQFRVEGLVQRELTDMGLDLHEGRFQDVLKGLTVRETLVSNFESVLDHELISDVKAALRKSVYPFVVVVNNRGGYVGVLSVDEVYRAEEHETVDDRMNYKPLNPFVKRFVEARDLIYMSPQKIPTVRVEASLAEVRSVFQSTPVSVVVGERDQVVGLLFVQEVRIAYDRELARRSLSKFKILS